VAVLPKREFGAEGVPPKREVELEGGFALLAPPGLFEKAGELKLKEDKACLAGLD